MAALRLSLPELDATVVGPEDPGEYYRALGKKYQCREILLAASEIPRYLFSTTYEAY